MGEELTCDPYFARLLVVVVPTAPSSIIPVVTVWSNNRHCMTVWRFLKLNEWAWESFSAAADNEAIYFQCVIGSFTSLIENRFLLMISMLPLMCLR